MATKTLQMEKREQRGGVIVCCFSNQEINKETFGTVKGFFFFN